MKTAMKTAMKLSGLGLAGVRSNLGRSICRGMYWQLGTSLWLFAVLCSAMPVHAGSVDLPKLPYDPTGLEPVISARTMEFHYGKHHAGYVNTLNKLIQGTPYESMSLEQMVKESDKAKATAIFNNAAQTWNHTFYFETLLPEAKGSGEAMNNGPKGRLHKAIVARWGSVEEFVKAFETAGAGVFGAGWVWLVQVPGQSGSVLEIVKESNAGTPITKGMIPLLVADVWEHAYYLDYQNRRADHLKAFWRIVNWKKVEARYADAGLRQ